MVSTADREYKETKKIILKKKNLNPRFQKLKDYKDGLAAGVIVKDAKLQEVGYENYQK